MIQVPKVKTHFCAGTFLLDEKSTPGVLLFRMFVVEVSAIGSVDAHQEKDRRRNMRPKNRARRHLHDFRGTMIRIIKCNVKTHTGS